MLLQVVIGACLDALEDFSIGSLNLSITFLMRNRCISDLDAKILAVSLERAGGELGPVVSDDPIQDSKPANNRLHALDCKLLFDLNHRGCFRALGELVDGDIQIPESSDGPRE
jgi:hypothetical protein